MVMIISQAIRLGGLQNQSMAGKRSTLDKRFAQTTSCIGEWVELSDFTSVIAPAKKKALAIAMTDPRSSGGPASWGSQNRTTPGTAMTRTPKNPTATAPSRCGPTVSPRNSAASRVMKSGREKLSALNWESGRVKKSETASRLSAKPTEPNRLRDRTRPNLGVLRKPMPRRRRTGETKTSPKKERKNARTSGWTSLETCLAITR